MILLGIALGLRAQDPRKGDSLYKDLITHGIKDTTYLDKMQNLQIALVFVRPDSVIKLVKQSLQIADSLHDPWRLARSTNMLGNCYKLLGMSDRALKAYVDALKLFETTGDKKWLANLHSNIGLMQMADGNYEQALKEQEIAIALRKEIGYFKGISAAYNTIGNVYSAQQRLPEALHYYELALDSAATEGPYNKGAYMGNIGNIYGLLGQQASSREMNREALKIHESVGLMPDMSRDLHNIADSYLKDKMLDSAIAYNLMAQSIADSFNTYEVLAAVAGSLRQAYALQKNYVEAYRWAENAIIANDSMYKQQMSNEGRTMELMYRIEKEEQAAQFSQKESLIQKDAALNRQRILLFSMGIGVLLLTGLAIVLVRRNKERNQANARLEFKVTERTMALSEANEQLNHEIQLKEAARLGLHTFLYRSSHDLKGPLKTMKGLVDVAKAEQGESPYLNMLGAKADHLDGILQQIIDQVEVDARVLQPQPIDLHPMWDELLTGLQQRSGFDEVKFVLEDVGLEELQADPFLLKLALRQLLQNAIDFRRKGASDNLCKLVAHGQGHVWTLKVEDHGIGFEPHLLDRDLSNMGRGSKQATGAGLGLYITKEIVKKIGATIQAETLEQGSVFTLTHV